MLLLLTENVGRVSVFSIEARYRLDCPEIESRWGRDFPQPSKPDLGRTQAPIIWVPALSRDKRSGPGVNHPTNLAPR